MGAFDIVEEFEHQLGIYTGAMHVVVVDSCTNAIFLSLLWHRQHNPLDDPGMIDVPRHTYAGVPQSVHNAGFSVNWVDWPWVKYYELAPSSVVDSAKFFERDMYDMWDEHELVCVSFHIAKRLPLGHGGAILLDDVVAARWLRRARFDGRTAGETGEGATSITQPGYHMIMSPPEAARGLWLLEQFVDQPLNASWEHYPNLSRLM